jgi:small-conductance mechanosensitive channel
VTSYNTSDMTPITRRDSDMAVTIHFRRLLRRVITLSHSRPLLSWVLTLLGGGFIYLACLGFFAVFAVLHLGYNLADSPSEYPGVLTWSVCVVASMVLAVLFLSGCFLIWSRVRRYVVGI